MEFWASRWSRLVPGEFFIFVEFVIDLVFGGERENWKVTSPDTFTHCQSEPYPSVQISFSIFHSIWWVTIAISYLSSGNSREAAYIIDWRSISSITELFSRLKLDKREFFEWENFQKHSPVSIHEFTWKASKKLLKSLFLSGKMWIPCINGRRSGIEFESASFFNVPALDTQFH